MRHASRTEKASSTTKTANRLTTEPMMIRSMAWRCNSRMSSVFCSTTTVPMTFWSLPTIG